jgi:hypothetical protein
MKKPYPTKRGPHADPGILFCTECGASLENFCFSKDAESIKDIKANLARCKHSGKFDGEFCSKLFIASDFEPLPTDSNPAPPRRSPHRKSSPKK